MKALTLTLLLAIMQATPPAPQEATDNRPVTAINVQSKSAPSHAESPPRAAPTKANGSGPATSDNNAQHPEDTKHTVEISKLPAVTITPHKRDFADWAYWVFNLLLVAVGVLQVVLLCWTLRAVRHQAHEMTRQRVTMGLQLEAMEGQLKQMEAAGTQTDKLIAQATVQAEKAGIAAEAAKASADAFVLSERA